MARRRCRHYVAWLVVDSDARSRASGADRQPGADERGPAPPLVVQLARPPQEQAGCVALGITVGAEIVAILLATTWVAGTGDWSILVQLLAGAPVIFGMFFAVLRLVQDLEPAHAIVGSDGVALVGIEGPSFVPYPRIARVTAAAAGVRLELDGGELLLRTKDPEAREALAARVAAGVETAAASSHAHAAAVALLDRCGRSIPEWKRALCGLAQAVDYRSMPPPLDAVARVLEHPASTPEQRVAAAIALFATDDPGWRLRVRAAAETYADDRLRWWVAQAARRELSERELAQVAGEGEGEEDAVETLC